MRTQMKSGTCARETYTRGLGYWPWGVILQIAPEPRFVVGAARPNVNATGSEPINVKR